MSQASPTTLSLLSDEIIFSLFKGRFLLGRSVCRSIRDRLWSAGTVANPLYLRIQPFNKKLANNLATELEFLKSFRHISILISSSKGSTESRALFKTLRSDFKLRTIQEITVSEVQTASRRGGAKLLSVTEKYITQSHPSPPEQVLAILLRALRRNLLGNSKNEFIQVSKRILISLLRGNALSDLLSEEFFTIFDIFVDIEDSYDQRIVEELVKMLKNGTEMQKEYAMSAMWILARHHKKVYNALSRTEAAEYLVMVASSGQEVLKDYALGTLMNLAEGTDEMKSLLQKAGVMQLFISEAQHGTEIRREYALEGLMHFTEGEEMLLDALHKQNAFDVFIEAMRTGTEIQTEYAVEAVMNITARSDDYRCVLAEKGAIEILVHLARAGLRTALATVCNFAAGEENVHIKMLSAGAVDLLFEFVSESTYRTHEREEVLWALESLANAGLGLKMHSELQARGIVKLLHPFTKSTSEIEREYAIRTLLNFSNSLHDVPVISLSLNLS
jgi:hypothetical protein